MCGGADLIIKRYPPDQVLLGVIASDEIGYLFFNESTMEIKGARHMARNLVLAGAKTVVVYSGLPRQVQKTIKNLNQLDGLKGYNPIEDYYFTSRPAS